MSHQSPPIPAETVRMEINGTPYYIKSKGGVPYIYDIDTHDEVGYWSSKKSQYIMFSLYNKMMKMKYEKEETEEEETETGTEEKEEEESETGTEEEEEEESDSEEEESDSEEEEEEESETKNKKSGSKSLVFVLVLAFIYLNLQKEFQSIYFDFIFLISINLLNTFKVFEMLEDDDNSISSITLSGMTL
jgi:cation transport ATPase